MQNELLTILRKRNNMTLLEKDRLDGAISQIGEDGLRELLSMKGLSREDTARVLEYVKNNFPRFLQDNHIV